MLYYSIPGKISRKLTSRHEFITLYTLREIERSILERREKLVFVTFGKYKKKDVGSREKPLPPPFPTPKFSLNYLYYLG